MGYAVNSTLSQVELNINALGASPDGSTDNYSLIQGIIDEYVGRKIVIGKQVTDVYIISKPLTPPTGSIIEVNGTLKLKDTSVKSLTANASIGATTISVDNSDGAFVAGQWIIISDDNKAVQGGGAWMTERVSDGNYITAATSTTLTLRTALISNFTTAANALVAHGQSVILLDNVDDVTITGTGVIDNNSNASARLNPTNENGINESIRQMSGISVETCDNIKIEGVTVKNAALHGVALHNLTNGDVRNISVDSTHGKAVLVWIVSKSSIKNVNITNSYNEDGFSMYNGNYNCNVYDIRCVGARRYGFALIGADNKDLNIDKLMMDANQIDVWVQTANRVNLSNVVVTGTHANQNTPISVSDASNINFSNVIVDNVTATRTVSISGTSSYINLRGMFLNNMSSATGVTVASTCSNVSVENSAWSSVGTCIELTGGVPTNTVFRNCSFTGYTTFVFSTNYPKFLKCSGTPAFVKASTARVKNGSTFAWVNHNLDITPVAANIKITPTSSLGSAASFWISDIGTDAFRINLNADPGADVTFSYVISDEYVVTPEAEVTYTTSHASDFSAGADSYSGTRLTVSGNNDAVDGLDNVLVAYATNVAGTHDLSRASAAQVGSTCRIRGKYRMPSGQTNTNGFRIYGNTFSSTLLTKTSSSIVYDAWTEFVTDEWVANNGTIYFRQMSGNSTSFTGANNSADDRLELRDIVVEYR